MPSASAYYDGLRHSLNRKLSEVSALRICPPSIQAIDDAPCAVGGYGEVRQATYVSAGHSMRSEHVAVKKLKVSDDLNKRLESAVALVREVSVWCKLDHPNTLVLLGFDLDEINFERVQLITPWQSYGNVLNYIKVTKPTYTRRLELSIDVAKGLAYLHGLRGQVCHGDVKPENVLVGDSGVAQLCDFGLARVLEPVEHSGLTTTSPLKMTLIYASPELVTGCATSHTCESDVWAWACSVMVIITGVLPYKPRATSSAILSAITGNILPEDLKKLPGLSYIVRKLLAECWSLEPANRPSMQQCQLRLSSYSTRGVIACNAPDLHSTMATLCMNPIEVPDELKDGGRDWFSIFNPHTPKMLDVRQVSSLAHDSIVTCVRFSPDGKLLATGCDGAAQIYNVEDGKKLHTLIHGIASDGVQAVCFSPDGSLLATAAEDSLILVWVIASHEVLHVFKGHKAAIYSMVFGPEGTQVISGSADQTARVWDLESRTNRVISILDPNTADAEVTSVAISRDSSYIATGSMDCIVRIWDLTSGNLTERLRGHSDSVYSVAFLPDGCGLVSGGLDKTVRYWVLGSLLQPSLQGDASPVSKDRQSASPDGGAINPSASASVLLSEHQGYVISVAVSPDGAWIASGATDYGVHLSDPATGLTQVRIRGHSNTVTDVDFSPVANHSDGLFASGSGDCTVKIWRYREGAAFIQDAEE